MQSEIKIRKDEVMNMKVGFIGLGIMGRPMSKNLVKAGHEVVVFDFNKDAVADLVSCGAEAAGSIRKGFFGTKSFGLRRYDSV